MNIVVCPYCRCGFRDTEQVCPNCGKAFHYADWPVEEVYSTDGKTPHLTLTWANNSWSPRNQDFFIGRDPGPDGLNLPDPTVSRKHARIFLRDGHWMIEKQGKEIELNESSLADPVRELAEGDSLLIASFFLKVSVRYEAEHRLDGTAGKLQTKDDLRLDPAEPVCIGSDDGKCLIHISGASPVHAAVYSHKPTGSWWIADCDSDSGTKVNGRLICNEQLYQGDKITVAGIDILFDGGFLRTRHRPNTGVEVSIRDVSVSRNGRDILRNIRMDVHAGDFVGVLGPSGCGKSSLIQRLVGLGSFDCGEVRVNSIPYQSRKHEIQNITAYVPQDVALHNDLTLEEEISIFCKLHLRSGSNDRQVKDALNLVGLDGKRNNRIGTLSGGEKRRAAIALELLRNPQLFILDEPTAGLDPATETDIMTYLRRVADQNRTVICSTHIMGNIRLFDKILFLSQGDEVFFGTPSELLEYFQADSPLKLYQKFGAGDRETQKKTAEAAAEDYRNSPFYKKYAPAPTARTDCPEGVPSANLIQQISGYLRRQVLDYFSFRHSQTFWKSLFFSPAFIQLLLLPVLVAFVIGTACADKFYYKHEYLFFFAAIAVFWFGLNTHIRELVKERAPWRCLERLEHISLFSYLSAKTVWTLAVSAVQVLMFMLFYALFAWLAQEIFDLGSKIPDTNLILEAIRDFLMSFRVVDLAAANNPVKVGAPYLWDYFAILYCCCVLGSWISLAVSAVFQKENSAVGLLPIILIPFLFFSQPIIVDDTFGEDSPRHAENCQCRKCQETPPTDPSNGQYCKFAIHAERVLPIYATQVLLDRVDNGKVQPADWRRMFYKTGLYMLVFLGLMIYFQQKNERKWEG